MGNHYRQGDVMLFAEAVPPSAQRSSTVGDVILALGETTGHAHRIAEAAGVTIHEHEGTRWIRVPRSGATLAHEEHGAIAIAPGDYHVVIQREYSPEEIRNVKD